MLLPLAFGFHETFKCIEEVGGDGRGFRQAEEHFAGEEIKAKQSERKKKSLKFYDDSHGFIVKCGEEEAKKAP